MEIAIASCSLLFFTRVSYIFTGAREPRALGLARVVIISRELVNLLSSI